MRHTYWALPTLWLLSIPTFGQINAHKVLRDALVLENRGSFEMAAKVAKTAIDSRRLTGNELGRGYIILAVACQGEGDLANAQIAYEQALHILDHDREHLEDYASALENYAGFYRDLGQLDFAGPMWQKAFHLRQRIGDHTGTALSLIRLSELALVRRRVREAHQYLQEASDEANISPDFTDDDEALLLETQGWLAISERRPYAAIAAYGQALELVERSRGGRHWLVGWERMLLGKAYAESGDSSSALANVKTGLTILDDAVGQKNPKYFAAELAYSQVLDRFGRHAEAGQIREAAEKASKDYYGSQCVGCTISVAAFR